MAKPTLDDLIDSVKKDPAPDPKKVAAEKKKRARKEALKNVPVAKKKSRAQRDKESSDSFIDKARKAVSDGRKKEVARKKSEDTLAKKTRSKELGDRKKSLEAKKAAGEEKGKKVAAELGSAKTTNVSSQDSSAEAGTKMMGNALSAAGAGVRAGLTAAGAGEKANRLKKKVMQKMKKNRGLKTGVSSTQSIKDRNAKKKKEKVKDPWNESMDWRDNYIPTEIETTDIIKPEPLKASNWREDFLWEVEDYPKEKKEKQIKPMTGKNTVIINPRIDEKYKGQSGLESIWSVLKNTVTGRGAAGIRQDAEAHRRRNDPTYDPRYEKDPKYRQRVDLNNYKRSTDPGGNSSRRNTGTGRDGKFGSGTTGVGMPSNPPGQLQIDRTPKKTETEKPDPPASSNPPSRPAAPAAPKLSAKDQAINREYDRLRSQPGGTKAGGAAEKFGKAAARAKFGDQKPKTPNPLMKGFKRTPASTASSTPKVTTPAPKVKPQPQRIPVQPFRSPSRGTTTNPGSRFGSVKPMRLTNSFSDWRGELQLEATYPSDFKNGVARKKKGRPNAQGPENGKKELDEGAEKRYCPKCDKVETKSECSYGPKYWEENAKKLDTQEESYTIDPKAHRKNQRAAKIRTLAKKGATEGERAAAEKKTKGPKMFGEGAAWTKKEGKNSAGGLNEKGRKSYERENPGSDLKAPSKKVGNPRRASFCARMKGMKKKLTSKKTASDPDSRINKSLRAWNC